MAPFSGAGAQGFNSAQFGFSKFEPSAKLQAISLPPKIRCKRCEKYKSQDAYSKKQLSHARYVRFRNKDASVDGRINCIACTGAQVVELKCYHCHSIKGLDGFSKTQRRLADKAVGLTLLELSPQPLARYTKMLEKKCNKCMAEQLMREPNDTLDADSDEDGDEEQDPGETEYYGPSDAAESQNELASTVGGESVGARQSTAGSQSTTGTWTVQGRPGESASQASRDFDPHKDGQPGHSASRASSGTVPSISRSQRPVATDKSGKWAKVKAAKPKPELLPYLSSDEEEPEDHDDGDDDPYDDI
ncbi:hypothetical protein EV356DRAFT_581047 [Viridothelium virens]|uniref:Stc1 domain-containing protein n=1 Tax=Viridothelium virens TaxID=1048519 RepID=A0A6A6GU24_VIRVR|nr:hypothetical protein EV356DRAFT_581047 [Viridothelium virens]